MHAVHFIQPEKIQHVYLSILTGIQAESVESFKQVCLNNNIIIFSFIKHCIVCPIAVPMLADCICHPVLRPP